MGPGHSRPSPKLFFSIHIFIKYLHFSKPRAEALPHSIKALTGSRSCCTHHRHFGANPSAGGVSSLQSVPFLSSLLPCPWPFSLDFLSHPVVVTYYHHTDTGGASLPIQAGYNPHRHPITSNHIRHVFLPFLYIFLNFAHLSLLQLSPILFLFSLSATPPFLVPLPSLSPHLCFPLSIFLSPSLPPMGGKQTKRKVMGSISIPG